MVDEMLTDSKSPKKVFLTMFFRRHVLVSKVNLTGRRRCKLLMEWCLHANRILHQRLQFSSGGTI